MSTARSQTALSKHLPRPLARLEEEMEGLMERFFSPERWTRGENSPRLNVAETASAYEVTADLPGINPAELDVQMKGGQLWIAGERAGEQEEEGRTLHRVERESGHFSRMIPLPGGVDEDQVSATYRDGVLTITIPKSPELQPRRIPINSPSSRAENVEQTQ